VKIGPRFRALASAFVLAVVVALVAPASPGGAATSNRGGTMTVLVDNEVPTFYGASATGSTATYMYWVYDSLVRFGSRGEIVPRLARSVTANSDATVWTMKLRTGVTFSDGTPFDANAVVTNWTRLKDPVSAAPCRTQIAAFKSFVATDTDTVTMTLSAPNSLLPNVLANPCVSSIASPAALSKYGTNYGATADSTVGAGPFVMKEWVRNDHYTFARRSGYWDAPGPYLDGFTAKRIPDQTQKASAFQAGQGDIAIFSAPTIEIKALTATGTKLLGTPGDGGTAVIFNETRVPFNDVRVRQALVLAVDLKDVILKANGGLATAVDTYFTKTSQFYDPKVKQVTNQLAKAQKLIDAYVAEKGGPVKFTLLVSGPVVTYGNALQQAWAKLKNVDVSIDSNPANAALQQAGNFDAAFQGTGADCSTIQQRFGTGQSGNFMKYSSPTVDKALADCLATTNLSKQKTALSTATKTIFDEAPALYVNRPQYLNAVQKSVRNIQLIGAPGSSAIDMATVQVKKSSG
jgi:peptide/nickel transport system substrate-binding protein